MSVKIVSNNNEGLVLELRIPFEAAMLDGEQRIEQTLNEAGAVASGALLKRFDTDGSALQLGDTKLTSKGPIEKTYQTPYGETRVSRHVYQSAHGGCTYCPLEQNARIIQNATPKLAKMLSHKYSKLSADEVQADFSSNHGRSMSRSYIQTVSEMVGTLAQAKEESWHYIKGSASLVGHYPKFHYTLEAMWSESLRNDGVLTHVNYLRLFWFARISKSSWLTL